MVSVDIKAFSRIDASACLHAVSDWSCTFLHLIVQHIAIQLTIFMCLFYTYVAVYIYVFFMHQIKPCTDFYAHIFEEGACG